MFCYVILDSKSRFLDKSFTYHIPDKFKNKIKKGMRVIVPFGKGNKNTIAFVYDIVENLNENFEIKDIVDIIDSKNLVDDELINLAFFMNKRYLSPLRACIKQVLPPGNIKEIKEYFYKTKNLDKKDKLYKILEDKKSLEDLINNYGLDIDTLRKYKKNKLIDSYFDINSNQNINYKYLLSLSENYKEIKIPKNAKKQIEIINYLKNNKNADYKDVLSKTNSSKSSLDSLVKKNIVKIEKIEVNESLVKEIKSYSKFSLNHEQGQAFNKIIKNPNESYLLKGVTGSGKTEVFLQIVEENLKK